MPDTQTLLIFSLTAIALVAIPGPSLIYITARAVSEGPRAGVISALGVETGTLVHVFAAAVGLSALLASSAVAFSVIKYAGAAYLIYLGVCALLGSEDPKDAPSRESASLARIYRQGLLVLLLSPKAALFFLAVLPQFVDPAQGAVALQIIVLGILLTAIGLASDCLYAFAAGALGGWLGGRPGAVRRQRQLSGIVYIALGAVAALGGVRAREEG